jgi:hypothetical protein
VSKVCPVQSLSCPGFVLSMVCLSGFVSPEFVNVSF